MKIAINKCYGGFGLSKQAYDFLGLEWDGYGYAFGCYDKRNDPDLIRCIETLGCKADGKYAKLKIIEIPDGVDYYIEDYDGMESIHEKHSIWY